MITVIKRGARKEDIQKMFQKMESMEKKGLDARKYCGILKTDKDPVDIQKRLRDEWQ